MRTWILPAVATLLLGSMPAVAAQSCLTCHPDVAIEYQTSAHAKNFDCTTCHGGDPAASGMEAHAPDKNYRGKPSRTGIPGLCASCHADAERMRAAGLPTDQYAKYQISRHGLLLAQGDVRVAVCTDCHGVHRILSRSDPGSAVFPRNIPETCGRCHADAQLMGAYKLPADQVEKFRQSVHGRALFVEEHPSAPTCATCHGSHGASDTPGMTAVCGHCHARTRAYLDEGPHKKAVADGKMSECVSCHGYHDTKHPDDTLFDTTCPACHASDSAGLRTARTLKTLLSQASESLDETEAEIDRAEQFSPTVVRYQSRLQQARAHFLEALPVQHALAVDRVEDLTRGARSVGDEVRASVHGVTEEMRLRYLVLAAAWVFILFAAGVAFLYRMERRRVESEHGDRDPAAPRDRTVD